MLGKKSRSGVSGVVIGSRKRLCHMVFYFFYFLLFLFFFMSWQYVIGPMAGVGSVQGSVCDAEGMGPDDTPSYRFFLFFCYASVLVNRQHRGLL